MKISHIILAVINLLILSIVTSIKLNKKNINKHSLTHHADEDSNHAIYDELELEDRWDETNNANKHHDNEYEDEESVDNLIENVREDLRGEDVSYDFD